MKERKYVWMSEDEFQPEKFYVPVEFKYEAMSAQNYFTKPSGKYCKNLFWGSFDDDDKYLTWDNWCKYQEFRNNRYFMNFKLKDDAKILSIDSYMSVYEFFKEFSTLDENELIQLKNFAVLCDRYYAKNEYSNLSKSEQLRIEETISEKMYSDIQDIIYSKDTIMNSWEEIFKKYDGIEVIHFDFNFVHLFFDTWDCDSICIWNKSKIVLLEGGKLW